MIIKSPDGWDVTIQDGAITSVTIKETWVEESWEYYLWNFKNLPHKMCSEYSFLPATKDEKLVCQRTVWMYEGLSEWLYYLGSPEKKVSTKLISTSKAALKLRAELSKSIFDLAIEVFKRDTAFRDNFDTPAEIWYWWEYQALETWFLNSGLLTGTPGIRPTKGDLARVNREEARALENQMMYLSQASLQELRMAAALEVSADYIARRDQTFRWSDALRKYIKIKRAWAKAVRSPAWQSIYLKNGKLLPNGRKAPRKKKGLNVTISSQKTN